MTSDDLLINPSDFKSTKIRISLENTTTHTELRDGRRFYTAANGKKTEGEDGNAEIIVTEFLENGFALELPSKTCSTGHNVMINIIAAAPTKIVNVSFSAKVTSVEHLDPKRDLVALKLVQFDEVSLSEFEQLFSSRQEEINQFLNSVKN